MRLPLITAAPAPRKRRRLRYLLALPLIPAVAYAALHLIPIPEALTKAPLQTPELTDRHGTPLRQLRVDERFIKPVTLEAVPPQFIHALLAAEDKRFYAHPGVDFVATGRALVNAALHRGPRSGASTITQQLVKISQPRPRTLRTKVIEAALALRLEQSWSKQQILEAYLNRLDFGHLNIGVASAAGYYFGKPLSDLTDAECAYLAGLPKNPTRLSPHRHSAAATRRQQTVLHRMAESGWLTPEQLTRALDEPLRLQPPRRVFAAPHFVDLVLPMWRAGESREATLRTTLDLDLQQRVDAFLRNRLETLRSHHVQNGAAVVLDNATGEVLALAGSEDYFAPGSGQVNGAWSRRSPGSALKPFTYLLAMEHGGTPATVVADVPTTFLTSSGIYQPENFNQRCYGPMRYRAALANSLNIPAVKVLNTAGGPAPLRDLLESWGLTTLDQPAEHYGLGLTIGNAEVRLLELANAYAALARLGQYRPFRVSAALTSPLPRLEPHAADRDTAWLLADMLSDNEARALAFGRQSALRFDFPVACKTGTSTDFRDNFAVAFTPEFTVAVWVGNFDGSAMREVSGVTGAAPLMHDIMQHLHQRRGTSWYPRPAEIVERAIQPITGKLLAKNAPGALHERFVATHLPPVETPADYDASGRPILGDEYRAWLASPENRLADRATVPATTPLRLLSPAPGSIYVFDPDLPTSGQIPLRAESVGALSWHSATLQCVEKNGQRFASGAAGRHELTVTDERGNVTATWLIIKNL